MASRGLPGQYASISIDLCVDRLRTGLGWSSVGLLIPSEFISSNTVSAYVYTGIGLINN